VVEDFDFLVEQRFRFRSCHVCHLKSFRRGKKQTRVSVLIE